MNEDFVSNIDKFSNERLCEVIVSHRYLGIMREEAILSMNELAKRRENGDMFQYEEKIEELISTLPKINLDMKKIFNSTKMPNE